MNQSFGGSVRSPVKELADLFTITSFRKLSAIAVYLVFSIPFVGSAEVSAQDKDPADQYRVLEWKDLVAEGWERPLLLTEEEVASPRIDPSSLVPELDQKLVAIPGFMRPAVKEGQALLAHDHGHEHEHLSAGTRVSEFVLVPFLPQNPCSHALWDPNQVVYVNLLEPVLVEDPESPVWVVGTITLDDIMTDDGLSAYRIVEAVTTNYEY